MGGSGEEGIGRLGDGGLAVENGGVKEPNGGTGDNSNGHGDQASSGKFQHTALVEWVWRYFSGEGAAVTDSGWLPRA